MSRLLRFAKGRFASASAVCLSFVLVAGLSAADKKPITKPGFDPKAESVELFAGIADGKLDVKLIPKDSKQGNLLIENKTDKPLTVQLPEAFVGVQVLQQFGAGAGGFGGQQGGLGGQGGGGGQALGGGMGGGGMGGGGLGGGGAGGGFFSVPPEKIVKVAVQSVCLNHGKPEPTSRMTYRIMPVDEYTQDPALQQLIRLVGTRKIDPQIAQAAAWHLTDNMSWNELAAKEVKRLGGVPNVPYFNIEQLRMAQQLVAVAETRAAEEKQQRPADDAEATTVVRTRRTR